MPGDRSQSLADLDRDLKRLAADAIARAAQRRGAKRIQPDDDAHMGVGRTEAVCRIEADPAETGHVGFGPRVPRLLKAIFVFAEITADEARRDAEAVRGADENVSEVRSAAASAARFIGSGS